MVRGIWPLWWLLAILALLPAAVHAASPVGVAQGTPQAAAAAAVPTDSFVRQALAVAKFHSDGSKLALRKTKNEHVVRFAHQMNLDYAAAGMKFRQAVAEAKLPMPRDALDPSRKPVFEQLSHTPPGKPFAKAYLEITATVLRDDLALFEAYAAGGDNERLKYFAREMAALVRGHLEEIGKLKK